MLFDSLRQTDSEGHLKEKIVMNKNASHSLLVIWKILQTTRLQDYVTRQVTRQHPYNGMFYNHLLKHFLKKEMLIFIH